MRMPTLLPFGEGRVSGEAIDTRTRSIRRGSGHGTLERWFGYSFGPHRYKANGLWYLSASPSKKSVQRFKTKIGNLLVPGNNDPWPEVRDTLNRSLLGWSNYFCHGTRRSAYRGVDRYVYERVRDFLARRHKVAGRGTQRFSCDVVYGERGLLRLERLPLTASLRASR